MVGLAVEALEVVALEVVLEVVALEVVLEKKGEGSVLLSLRDINKNRHSKQTTARNEKEGF